MSYFVIFGNANMSKIGKKPIKIPAGATVTVEGRTVVVNGPKGELKRRFSRHVEVKVENDEVKIERVTDHSQAYPDHGLYRALIQNMVKGVTDGFSKKLEIKGVGYRAAVEGKNLVLTVGYIHPISIDPPEGITFQVEENNKITVEGIDNVLVGNIAAKVRSVRPPEPYKGKGIRYLGEEVKIKTPRVAKVAGEA